jgi:hypothetical protein
MCKTKCEAGKSRYMVLLFLININTNLLLFSLQEQILFLCQMWFLWVWTELDSSNCLHPLYSCNTAHLPFVATGNYCHEGYFRGLNIFILGNIIICIPPPV